MNKKLFLTASAFCFMALPVMADCVCGTANCEKCDSTEDYLEDVGEHMKKQARKIKKTARKNKVAHSMHSDKCPANQPSYWFEEAELLDKNGNVILTYSEMVEDDTFELSASQQKQAGKDAKALKDAGQKLKDKAAAAKSECIEVMSVSEEIDEYPVTNNRMKKKGKKHSSKKAKSMGAPQLIWVEGMEQNGNMLIEAGDFIEENMSK